MTPSPLDSPESVSAAVVRYFQEADTNMPDFTIRVLRYNNLDTSILAVSYLYIRIRRRMLIPADPLGKTSLIY